MADMTLAEALALADQDSPMPHLAGRALKVLRAAMYAAAEEINTIAYRCDRTDVGQTEFELNRVSDQLRPLPSHTKDC